MEIDYYFVSAEEYAKQTGIGPEEAKKQCRLGKLEYFMTEKGHYKIKVYKDGSVPREQYESLKQECEKYKTLVNSAIAVLTV